MYEVMIEQASDATGFSKEVLGNAVNAIIASKQGSYIEAQSYQNMLPKSFGNDDWQAAHNIVDKIEEWSD
jgi:hypothetical protein